MFDQRLFIGLKIEIPQKIIMRTACDTFTPKQGCVSVSDQASNGPQTNYWYL